MPESGICQPPSKSMPPLPPELVPLPLPEELEDAAPLELLVEPPGPLVPEEELEVWPPEPEPPEAPSPPVPWDPVDSFRLPVAEQATTAILPRTTAVRSKVA